MAKGLLERPFPVDLDCDAPTSQMPASHHVKHGEGRLNRGIPNFLLTVLKK